MQNHLDHTNSVNSKTQKVNKNIDAKPEDSLKVVSLRNEILFGQSLTQCKSDFICKWKDPPPCPKVIDSDFQRIRELGEGAFGRVLLVKHKASNALYASKILNKEHILKSKCKEHVLTEKRVLQCVDFPFLIKLHFYYKDDINLYLVLEYVESGDLFAHLKRVRRFDDATVKFFAAQVVLAMEYLHFNDLLYRDLKPENILLDNRSYVKITDFGFVKFTPDRTWTICGTPEYMSPEIIENKGYNKCSDWWSLGVLIYEMTAGYTPFRANEESEIFRNIVNRRYVKCPRMTKECCDLVDNLLQSDVRKRYGALKNGITDITHHPWFYKTDWEAICARTLISPYAPKSVDKEDPLAKDENRKTLLKATPKTHSNDKGPDTITTTHSKKGGVK